MVEPISVTTILALSLAVGRICATLVAESAKLDRTNPVVKALGQEIVSLRGLLERVEELGTHSNANANLASGQAKKHIESVSLSLGECKGVLEKLEYKFQCLDKVKQPSLVLWKRAKLGWLADDIAQYRHEISECRTRIAIDLGMISAYHSCDDANGK
jgi:hypothetical protein